MRWPKTPHRTSRVHRYLISWGRRTTWRVAPRGPANRTRLTLTSWGRRTTRSVPARGGTPGGPANRTRLAVPSGSLEQLAGLCRHPGRLPRLSSGSLEVLTQCPAAVLALTRSATAWLHLAQRVSGKGKKINHTESNGTHEGNTTTTLPSRERPTRSTMGEATTLPSRERPTRSTMGEDLVSLLVQLPRGTANRSRNGRGARQLANPYDHGNTRPPCSAPRAITKGNGRNRSHNGRGARQLV